MIPAMPEKGFFMSNGEYMLLVLSHLGACVLPRLAAFAYLYMLAGAVLAGLSCRVVSALTGIEPQCRLRYAPRGVAWWIVALWPALVPYYWARLAGGALWHLFIGLRLSHALDMAGLMIFLAGLGYERDGDGE